MSLRTQSKPTPAAKPKSIFARRVRDERDWRNVERVPKRYLVSENSKTGISINFPVSTTCKPTKVCQQICYACRMPSHIAMPNALRKAWTTYYYFEDNEVAVIAERLYREFKIFERRIGLKKLRWNGVGDLFPKAVEVLNYMAEHYDVTHLVYSRRPEMINQLIVSPRLHVLYSLDESSWQRWTEVTRPTTAFGYLRTSDFVPPIPLSVVLRAHRQWKELPDHKADCPVDAHVIPHTHGCIGCNICKARGLKD